MIFLQKINNQIIKNNFKTSKGHEFFTRDKLNKIAGNSIVVDVLEELFKQINYLNDTYFE